MPSKKAKASPKRSLPSTPAASRHSSRHTTPASSRKGSPTPSQQSSRASSPVIATSGGDLTQHEFARLEAQVQKFADAVIIKAFPTDGDETQHLNILTDILSQGKEKWDGPFVTLHNLIAAQLDWPTEVVIQQASVIPARRVRRPPCNSR